MGFALKHAASPRTQGGLHQPSGPVEISPPTGIRNSPEAAPGLPGGYLPGGGAPGPRSRRQGPGPLRGPSVSRFVIRKPKFPPAPRSGALAQKTVKVIPIISPQKRRALWLMDNGLWDGDFWVTERS